jgi:esterase/lipase/1-acyl-sn-glycerol-3-phosphate acyltransferase
MNNQTSVKAYKYTVLAMGFLEKLLGSKITVDGLENLPPKPVLFVANHFTRAETFIVPYIIHKYTKRQVRCLADNGLFHGFLGRFLKSVGALSTRDKKRDLAIISDLVKGDYDWMIYPEGSMIKSKEIRNNNKSATYSFSGVVSGEENRIRTGSAVLALKSELYRMDLIEAHKKDKTKILDDYQRILEIEYDPKFKDLQTQIVPLNITYYPIRPGKNIIQKIAGKVFKKLPAQISEELEIEGNLLLSADINIHFGEAINLTEYVKSIRSRVYQIPIIKVETKANLVLRYLKYSLTNKFMEAIYSNAQINIDHIAVAILYFYPKNEIDIDHLKFLIHLSINHIVGLKKYRINPSNSKANLYKLLADENLEEFTSIIQLATNLGIITDGGDKRTYLIDKNKLQEKYSFQQIRISNTPQVILNEFLLLENAVSVIKRNVLLNDDEVKQKSFNYIVAADLDDYEYDYKLYYDENLSKNQTIGMPIFLDNESPVAANSNNNSIDKSQGILLVHGYLASPKEMEEMAKYFNNAGFKTYCVRLKGHGTSPINMENVKWKDWYNSLNCGYAALKLVCSKVVIVGFSTGGLLSLMAGFKKDSHLGGVVCINPALKLNDIRAKFVSGIYIWNELLEKFKIKKGQLSYVENHPENPDINYSRNYIKGMEQLESLMNICDKNLEKITCPILIVQSKDDPVINNKEAKISLEKIKSNVREFQEIDSLRHVIIKGQGSDEVFNIIKKFIEKL